MPVDFVDGFAAVVGEEDSRPPTSGSHSRDLVEVHAELLTAEEAAGLCGVSLRTWRRLHAERAIPGPISLGGRLKRWRRSEMMAWISLDCPSRAVWEGTFHGETKRRAK